MGGHRFGTKSVAELERPQEIRFDSEGKAHFDVDIPFVKKVTDAEKGTLELSGYASTWVKDRDEEWIDPSAFDKSLAYYMKKNPIILWQHDMEKPIGTMEQAFVDDFGLNVVAHMAKPTDKEPDWAHLAYNKTMKGIVRTFSIGGFFHRDFIMGRQVIQDIELMEVSVVSIPSNPESIFEAASKALQTDSPTSTLRPSLTPGHIRQMKQIIGLEALSDPELVVMSPAERVARYEFLVETYRKCGRRAPSIDAWKKLEPKVHDAKGEAAIGISEELIALVSQANGAHLVTNGKRGRAISKANEDKLREAQTKLSEFEEKIDGAATEAKKICAETREEIDLVLKHADEPEDDPAPGDEAAPEEGSDGTGNDNGESGGAESPEGGTGDGTET